MVTLRNFEIWTSSIANGINGSMMGSLTVPIQYAAQSAYQAAADGAPKDTSGAYKMKAIFNGSLNPSVAFNAYNSVANPYLFPGLITGDTKGRATSQWKALFEKQKCLVDITDAGAAYVYITYAGSRYAYRSGARVDLQTGATAGSGVVSRLFQSITFNSYYKSGIEGSLSDFLIDSDAGKFFCGPIYAALFEMGPLWPDPLYHHAMVAWGGTNGTVSVTSYSLSDSNVQWLLQAPGHDRPSLYLYLFSDATGKIYSYQEGLQFEVTDGLSAETFGAYGMLSPPPEEILSALDRPKVYRWTDLMPSALPLTAKVWAIPTENTVESIVDLSQAVTLISITAQYSGDVRVSYSYDNGGTWTEPRPMAEFLQIPMSQIWRGMDASKKIRFRLALESSNAELKQFLVRWGRENGA